MDVGGGQGQQSPPKSRDGQPGAEPGASKVSNEARKSLVLGLAQALGTFLAACGVGICHHVFYSYLHGTVAVNQTWYLSAGNAIAYGARILFAASIGLCLRQWFWRAMRSKPWTLGTIDKLHEARQSPVSLLHPGFAGTLVSRAPLGFLIMLVFWLLPIIPILAPTSLSVRLVQQTLPERPLQITNLNFSRTADATDASSRVVTPFTEVGILGAGSGMYIGPSSRALGLVYSTLNGGQISPLPSPCNGNCTFNQTFFGPAYKCDEVTPETEVPEGIFYNIPASDIEAVGIISTRPYVATWYWARLANCKNATFDGAECPQTNTTSGGIGSPAIGDATASSDSRFWIFYRWLPPEKRDVNRTVWDGSIWENHKIMCQQYNASFNIQRTYLGLGQHIQGSVEHLNPISYGKSGSWIGLHAAYTIHDIIFSLIGGSIGGSGGPEVPVVRDFTKLSGTRLVEAEPFPPGKSSDGFNPYIIQKPVRDLGRAIEELHFNVTVGMLSIPDLVYLQNETVPATHTVTESQWAYRWTTLLAVYAGFALANVAALVVGLFAVADNGGRFVRDDGFLRILMTTRNPDLDGLVARVSDGRGDDHQQALLEKHLVRFGYLDGHGRGAQESRAVGFGFPDSVVGLREPK